MGASELARWVRRRREELGLSRQQLAVKTRPAVSYSTIVKVEQGVQVPTAQTIRGLAVGLRTSPEFLFKLGGLLPGDAKAPEPEEPHPVSLVDATRPSDKGGDPDWTDQEKQELLDFAQFLRSRRSR